ncbi:hypothetical protein EX895_004373 [Sporisorium graminicola]|uniref:Zn(2)-C6 fungal-type domain-containing protein n=1 Tax=Sporisorium graminicola TaxID=280036 RepID=A0A4U7KQZ3_9BASI|nr:hypothetical protein EX895_004373 [Sporisorium graminicola]TKY86733.1 hypothetical protein EX895_004373 [Sporisorium graminicola]
MNSLADAAIQASAVAAEASAATAAVSAASVPGDPTQVPLSTPDSASRPEDPSSVLGRSSSTHPPIPSLREADESTSPASNPETSIDMLNKNSADTPLRRALLDTEKPEKRGSNLACLKCRAIKVKCSRANAEDERCKRCNRLDLVCEFKEHHRGRKPKKRPRSEADSTGADEEDQLEDDEVDAASLSTKANTTSPIRIKARELSRSPPPPTPPKNHQQHQQYHTTSHKKGEHGRFNANEPPSPKLPSPKGSVHGRWFGPYLQPIPSFEDSLFSRKSQSLSHSNSAQHHHPHQQYSHQPQQGQQHQHSYHHDRSRELPPLSIQPSSSSNRNGLSPHDQCAWDRTSAWNSTQSSLHRAQQTPSAAPPAMASDLRDDAVRQHVVTMDQAHELFNYYFTELNPPLALLDASLHTVEHVRQSLPILFSTIISVASRFFLPQHHRQCHRIAKSILNMAAAEEICSMDHIQALILVITWKDPGDRTILRKAVRAIGYAYELGLHAAFDDFPTADSSSSTTRARSDSYSQRLKRRQDRDRQRTWIVLCLIHELVRRDDRNTKPRARIIPPEDYPDPNTWIKQSGDVLLPVDSRLAWSLDMSLLTLENEPFLDHINRSEDATPFESFFDRYRTRLDMLRKRYFDVRDGVFHPRLPMDKSAVAELPYLDAFRDFYICQSTWHWAAKVASNRRSRRSELAEQQDNARSAFWFAQTVDTAMRCMRLFAKDLCEPGYVRVGHDYLVISASEVTKWFYLYREHLDASTITTGVECLRATLRECSQPQRLASGEVVDTEREAPGYFVRFLGAIFEAGLDQSFERAKKRLAVDVERYRFKPSHWNEVGRGRAHSSSAADEHAAVRREMEAGPNAHASARRPPWVGAHSSYQQKQQQEQQQPGGGVAAAAAAPLAERGSGLDRTPHTSAMAPAGGSPPFRDVASATARYSTAPSLPRGRSEMGPSRVTTHAAPGGGGGATSYERASGGGIVEKSQTLPVVFGTQPDVSLSTANLNTGNSMAPHPAYLTSPGAGAAGQALPSGFAVQGGGTSWPPASTIASSWSNNSNSNSNNHSSAMVIGGGGGGGGGIIISNNQLGGLAATATAGADFSMPVGGFGGPSGLTSQTKTDASNSAATVVPLAADMGKNSIEGLAACLDTRDLTYWHGILGFDLTTPAV